MSWGRTFAEKYQQSRRWEPGAGRGEPGRALSCSSSRRWSQALCRQQPGAGECHERICLGREGPGSVPKQGCGAGVLQRLVHLSQGSVQMSILGQNCNLSFLRSHYGNVWGWKSSHFSNENHVLSHEIRLNFVPSAVLPFKIIKFVKEKCMAVWSWRPPGMGTELCCRTDSGHQDSPAPCQQELLCFEKQYVNINTMYQSLSYTGNEERAF